MKKIDAYFKDYEAYHHTSGNKITHLYGVSLIIVSLFGLLHRWHPAVAIALFVIGNAFYLKLNLRLGLSMVASTGIFYGLGLLLNNEVLWSFFILGWVLQGVGHFVFEKRSPAFTKNFIHILVGPAYLQNYYLRIYRAR